MNKYTNTFTEDLWEPLGTMQRSWLRRTMLIVVTPLIFTIEGLRSMCTACEETFTFVKDNW